jgi:hypothetical protein
VAGGDPGGLSTSRYRLTLALRQTLGAAVRWRYLTRNPAVDAGGNPEPRSEELLPCTPGEIDALAVELGPVCGPLVVFCAETGVRTNEWTATERREWDRLRFELAVGDLDLEAIKADAEPEPPAPTMGELRDRAKALGIPVPPPHKGSAEWFRDDFMNLLNRASRQ